MINLTCCIQNLDILGGLGALQGLMLEKRRKKSEKMKQWNWEYSMESAYERFAKHQKGTRECSSVRGSFFLMQINE